MTDLPEELAATLEAYGRAKLAWLRARKEMRACSHSIDYRHARAVADRAAVLLVDTADAFDAAAERAARGGK